MEQFKQFAEMQKLFGNPGNNIVTIVSMVLGALSTVFAAIAGWVGAQAAKSSRASEMGMDAIRKTATETTDNVAKIHTEVNSKTSAMISKLDEQNAVILALTKELATLRERGLGAALPVQKQQAPSEDTGLLKKIASSIEQYETVVGAPPAKPGDPALRTTK